MDAIDIIIPVFNEKIDVVRETVEKARKALANEIPVTFIIVNDGSSGEYGLDALQSEEGLVYISHDRNRGYGAALKTGIRAGSAPWIAITDADGTYPVEELPALASKREYADMVIGVRTGRTSEIPLLRRLPKYVLNRLASYMAGIRINDLNSGLRLFRRELCYRYWGLLPQGFSFTSTITMGAVLDGHHVVEHPINYYKRTGKSSIRPIKDTLHFLHIILRMGVLFHPMKLFAPVSGLLFLVGAGKGFLRDYFVNGYIGNLSIMFMLVSIQIILMGYIGELIVKSRTLSKSDGAGDLVDRDR